MEQSASSNLARSVFVVSVKKDFDLAVVHVVGMYLRMIASNRIVERLFSSAKDKKQNLETPWGKTEFRRFSYVNRT